MLPKASVASALAPPMPLEPLVPGALDEAPLGPLISSPPAGLDEAPPKPPKPSPPIAAPPPVPSPSPPNPTSWMGAPEVADVLGVGALTSPPNMSGGKDPSAAIPEGGVVVVSSGAATPNMPNVSGSAGVPPNVPNPPPPCGGAAEPAKPPNSSAPAPSCPVGTPGRPTCPDPASLASGAAAKLPKSPA
eukprot:scaffold151172_cov19-Tisochrysis_lutea.AAC.5